ncbi:MAG TPA: hydroxyacylglutathione hydrolase [Nevskiaceae bacterium]|nr:hydroxyacylglutathione hydrolase [Nevskiaceae bacterium]
MITAPSSSGLVIEALPAFTDNYLWLIHDGHAAGIVDPGDAAVVQAAILARHLELRTILVTHHHADHTGGIKALKAATGARVIGPAMEASRIPLLDQPMQDGELVAWAAPALQLQAITVPGHTAGHMAYYAAEQGWLLCGDTLFSAGCGRLFEGTAAQMYASLQRLAALPDDTRVYCAHEYTLANLRFARAAEPGNAAIVAALADAEAAHVAQRPTVPSTLRHERATNPFLRCAQPELAAGFAARSGESSHDPVRIFAALRRWKDGFRA